VLHDSFVVAVLEQQQQLKLPRGAASEVIVKMLPWRLPGIDDAHRAERWISHDVDAQAMPMSNKDPLNDLKIDPKLPFLVSVVLPDANV
jgi:hypothetical protein